MEPGPETELTTDFIDFTDRTGIQIKPTIARPLRPNPRPGEKPLKRLLSPAPRLHRAEAPVLMRIVGLRLKYPG